MNEGASGAGEPNSFVFAPPLNQVVVEVSFNFPDRNVGKIRSS